MMNGGGLDTGLADTLRQQGSEATARMEAQGLPAVLVVQQHLRTLMSRFLRRQVRQLVVLSQAEIPDDRTVRIEIMIGGRS